MTIVSKTVFAVVVSAGTVMAPSFSHAQSCDREGATSASCRPEGGATGSHPEGGATGSQPEGGAGGSHPEGGTTGSQPEGGAGGSQPEGGATGSLVVTPTTVSVGGRRIVDLGAGIDATDAVNVGQLNAVATTASNALSLGNAASAEAATARAVAGNALSSAQAAQATAGDALSVSSSNSTDIQALRRTSVAQGNSISTVQAMQSAQAGQIASLQSGQNLLGDRVDTLYDLRDHDRHEAQSGVAAAIALANAPMPSAPGRTTYALNGATFRSGQAVGGSVLYRLDTESPFAIGAGFSFAGGRNSGARIGVAGEF